MHRARAGGAPVADGRSGLQAEQPAERRLQGRPEAGHRRRRRDHAGREELEDQAASARVDIHAHALPGVVGRTTAAQLEGRVRSAPPGVRARRSVPRK